MVNTLNKNKKILFISSVFPNYKAGWWQAQVAYDYAKWLLGKWYEVTVLTNQFDDLSQFENINWMEIIRFWNYSKMFLKFWLYTPKWLLKYLIKNTKDFDYLFIHDIFNFYWYFSALISKLYKINYLFMPHGMWDISKQKEKKLFKKVFIFFFSNFISKNARKLIFCSRNEKDNYNLPYKDYQIIHNWIHQKDWIQNLSEINENDRINFRSKYNIINDKIILSLWRLVKAKRFDKTISYLQDFLKSNSNYKLLIAWPDWWEKNNLLNLIEELDLINYVIIIDWLFGKEKYIAYKISDFFCLSSYLEWFPIVVCEAITSKLPCLLSEWCNIEKNNTDIFVFKSQEDFNIQLNTILKIDKTKLSLNKDFDITQAINTIDTIINT